MSGTLEDGIACPECGWILFRIERGDAPGGDDQQARIRTISETPAFTDFDRENDTCNAVCPDCEGKFPVRISLLWPY